MRNILLAVTGMSPQVVTETLFALVAQREFIPSEIHIMTTELGKNRVIADLLDEQSGQFHAFCREYQLIGRIRFNIDCVHVIKNNEGVALPDIRTPEENECAANQILAFVRDWCAQENTCIHASIAGGRKSMGFYLGYALSLFAREQDSASHVLVSSPFEGLSKFFFPPVNNTKIVLPDGSIVESKNALVMLADVPIVKLRAGLPAKMRNSSNHISYSEAVQIAQRNIPRHVHLCFDAEFRKCTVWVNQLKIKLPNREFALLYLMAKNLKSNGVVDVRNEATIEEYLTIYKKTLPLESEKFDTLTKNLKDSYDDVSTPFEKHFSQTKARLAKLLLEQLDVLAQQISITLVKSVNGQKGIYQLNLEKEDVVFQSL
jgi:CRISPR-associated protein (TIGR02584 family)